MPIKIERHVACAALLLTACVDGGEPEPELDSEAAPLSAAVGPNVRISDDSTMAAQDQPTAATVWTRPGHLLVAAHSYPPGATQPIGGQAAFWLSRDGGRTFPIRGVVPGLTGGAYAGASDLSLACASTGDCYLASFVYDTAIARTAIAVSHSRDGGATWDAPAIVITEDDPAIFNERCSVAVDDSLGPNRGSVYVSWIRVDAGGDDFAVPIWFAASRDRGRTFSAPRVISDPAENLLTDKPETVVDRGGRVYVVYENFLLDDPERDRHVIQRSDDGGRHFGAAQPVSYVFDTFEALPPASFRHNSFPHVAAEPLTGALLVTWTDTREGPGVLLTRSTDHGVTWSTPVRVDDPALTGVQHAFPAIACNPIDVCGVSFYTSRNDPVGLRLDTYFAPVLRGRPGHNVRVSDVAMNPDAQFGGGFIGDYNALVIDLTAAHPVWTDTRVARPDPQQDVFTARITVQP